MFAFGVLSQSPGGIEFALRLVSISLLLNLSLVSWRVFFVKHVSLSGAILIFLLVGYPIGLVVTNSSDSSFEYHLVLARHCLNLLACAVIADIIILTCVLGNNRFSAFVDDHLVRRVDIRTAIYTISSTGVVSLAMVLLTVSQDSMQKQLLEAERKRAFKELDLFYSLFEQYQQEFFSIGLVSESIEQEGRNVESVTAPMVHARIVNRLNDRGCRFGALDVSHAPKKPIQDDHTGRRLDELPNRRDLGAVQNNALQTFHWTRKPSSELSLSVREPPWVVDLSFRDITEAVDCFFSERDKESAYQTITNILQNSAFFNPWSKDTFTIYDSDESTVVSLRPRVLALTYLYMGEAFVRNDFPETMLEKFKNRVPVPVEAVLLYPYRSIYQSMGVFILRSAEYTMFALLILLLLISLMTNQLIKPMQQLVGFLQQPDDSRRAYAVKRSHIADFRHFLEDILSLWSEAQDMRRSSERAKDTLQWINRTMPIGIATFQSDGSLVESNNAFTKFVGGDDGLASEVYELALHGETNDEVREVCLSSSQGEKFALISKLTGKEEETSYTWVVLADITEEKVRERQLYQSAKMANLGELATGTAHELNQPLNHIKLLSGNIKGLLSGENSDSAAIIRKLEKVESSVDRAATIIQHMRAFGRGEELALQPISISAALEGALLLMGNDLKTASIEIKLSIEEQLPHINGVESRLEQVFINLLSNARDAIVATGPASRVISIDVSSRREEIVVVIQDSGGGVSEQEIGKIFEPFYTTKNPGSGTGLGGSISYGIVSSFGGKMSARNRGSGLLIEISFPRIQGC